MLLLQTERLNLRLRDYYRSEKYDVLLRPDHAYVIGTVELRFELGATEAALGYGIHDWYQRKGYATEAAARLLEHAFRGRGLRRVFAAVETSNGPSIRVCQKLGMQISVRAGERGWDAYAIESTAWWIRQGGQDAARG